MLKTLKKLYFKPRVFFENLAEIDKKVIYLAAVFVGISLSIGRVDKLYMRHLMRESGVVTLPDQGWLSLADTVGRFWGSYWSFVIYGGVISAFFIYWLGGAWYTLRLRLCRIRQADIKSSRKIYLLAHLGHSLPTVLILLACSLIFDNYVDYAENSSSFIPMLITVLLLWSVYLSYNGIISVYQPNSLAWIKLWFVVLPVLVYLLPWVLVIFLAAQ